MLVKLATCVASESTALTMTMKCLETKSQWPMPNNLDYLHYQCRKMIEKANHDDVIKWKNFPRYWPFVRGIHRSPLNSPHKGLWRWALMFTLICARINGWVNNGEAGDLRRYLAHSDAIVMAFWCFPVIPWSTQFRTQKNADIRT